MDPISLPDVGSQDKNHHVLCCIGAGYVGATMMAVLATHCPDYRVIVVDKDVSRVDAWNSDNNFPIYEPGLGELIVKTRGANLSFTTDIVSAIEESSIIFVAVNTPLREFGSLAGKAYDLSAYESVARTIAAHARDRKIIVEKSTVPVRTADHIRKILDTNKKPGASFEVISNPEFLAEGTAVANLQNPDRVLIGGFDTESGRAAVRRLSRLYQRWVESDKIILSGLYTSELTKLACNALLSQRVASINSLTELCERTGADIGELTAVVGRDTRIGSKFLAPSPGFGGPCLIKDLRGLIYLCESLNLPEVAAYWAQVLSINEHQKHRFARLVSSTMYHNLKYKDICVLGFTFKKNTDDFRESASVDLCRFLIDEGAKVHLYDPKAPVAGVKALFPEITVAKDPYAAAENTHAIVVMTEWDEFQTLDYAKLYEKMAKPAYIFDGRNNLNHKQLKAIGYEVFSIGKGFIL
jgi:UDPglucose 6-dehydrogenase